MIKSFRDNKTEAVFNGNSGDKKWRSTRKVAQRKLTFLNGTADLNDLRTPPGNRHEKLGHDRRSQHSICINDQWRVCFNWIDGDAHNVEIVDYH